MRMHLRDYTRAIDVPHYTCAISPGKHCPLFGVGIVFQGLAGVTLIYIGPQDCVYYAQTDIGFICPFIEKLCLSHIAAKNGL